MSESGVALGGPGGVQLSESGGLGGVHSGGSLVVGDDRVIVINVGLQDTFSADGIVPLRGQSSKLLSPSGNSGVL